MVLGKETDLFSIKTKNANILNGTIIQAHKGKLRIRKNLRKLLNLNRKDVFILIHTYSEGENVSIFFSEGRV